jgi:4-amino-4-deoxy-L-arabinose transferase-like glycosyltransferase
MTATDHGHHPTSPSFLPPGGGSTTAPGPATGRPIGDVGSETGLFDPPPPTTGSNRIGTGGGSSIGEPAATPGQTRRRFPGHDLDLARWEPPVVGAVLAATALLYLWGLGASGWANSFYSAAVQAGSVSWKAFLFGASDGAGSITVDKPPASLWVMALSVRVFGLSSWSILVPQALMGVATVATVWYAIRRWFSAGAAVLAAVALAITPVAVLMFRFNNPDALLTLVMSLAAVTALRGIEDGKRRWMIATGALVGLGFLTKQLQVMLIVPPFALAHLVAGRGSVGRRLVDLVVAGAALVVSAGWWVALVELWPADSRPWIGGSQTNSILELTFGYNGLGRLTGDEVGSVAGGGGPGAGGLGPNSDRWGETGITRMFDGVIGGQIAWLLPVALAAVVGGLWATRRADRTDLRRAGLLVWGGWLVVTVLVFSFMAGIFHEYYTVALAPAVAAMVGIGADLLWRSRGSLTARVVAAAAVIGSALWAVDLLGRAGDWNAWLRPAVLLTAVAAAIALVGLWHRRVALAAAGSALAAAVLLAGPAAWALETAATAHSGSIVTAGPAVEGEMGGRGGFGQAPIGPGDGTATNGGSTAANDLGGQAPIGPGDRTATNGGSTAANDLGGQAPIGPGDGTATNGRPTAGDGRPPLGGPTTDGLASDDNSDNGTAGGRAFGPGGGQPAAGFPGGMNGGAMGAGGGLLDAAEPSEELTDLLLESASDYTWVAAAVGANNAAGYQLATEEPVMPLGGFNASDPSPTLEEFRELVASGEIHWFIEGGRIGASNGGSNEASAITQWVTTTFDSIEVDGAVLYDLTGPTG